MNRIALILTVLIVGLFTYIQSVAYGQEIDYNGSWGFDGKADIDVGEPAQCTFTITLKQDGSKISGEYVAVALDGRRMDYDNAGGNKITGKISGNVANVRFESSGWGGSGSAKITHLGDKLIWEIVKTSKPDHWCPKKVTLVKESK